MVGSIAEKGICLKCGMCAGVCPMHCISVNKKLGLIINEKKCSKCGMCRTICPSLQEEDVKNKGIKKCIQGRYIKAYVGRSKDRNILANAVSGGVVSELICGLLSQGEFQYAVGVRNRIFKNECNMELFCDPEWIKLYQKSVYTMPSYENVIHFIRTNRDKKVIVIGSGCIISAIKSWMLKVKINIDNYFFIGLFCDCTLNDSIEKYFEDYGINKKDVKITGINYRSKIKGSHWPGNIEIVTSTGRSIMVPREERYKVVKYFKNKRCLFCTNHLNVNADISVGDNYTNIYSDKYGSNSMVVRTETGRRYLELIRDRIVFHEIAYDNIITSQKVIEKEKNYIYSSLFLGDGIGHIKGSGNIIKYFPYVIKYYLELSCIQIGKHYTKYRIGMILYLIARGKSKIENRLFVMRSLLRKT